MTIDEVSTIGDTLFYLAGLTKRPWSMAEFTREVIRRRLPIYARAPSGVSIVSRKWVDGQFLLAPQPSMASDYVTLLQDEIEELATSPGPRIITDRPAWLFGDVPYHSWEDIVAFRRGNHRVLGYCELDPGEWMGQSDEYFFSELVQVTAETTLVVPRFVIAELALYPPTSESNTARTHGDDFLSPLVNVAGDPTRAKGAETLGSAGCGTPSTNGETSSSVNAPTGVETHLTQQTRKTNTWDQHDLRRLLEESLLPGNTQAVLAEKYGVTRQFIGKQLAKAKDLHGVRPASPFDVLGGRARKK